MSWGERPLLNPIYGDVRSHSGHTSCSPTPLPPKPLHPNPSRYPRAIALLPSQATLLPCYPAALLPCYPATQPPCYSSTHSPAKTEETLPPPPRP
ncbi:MAG: hypothetical protein AAF609_25735 [Cyanobacteria bacterium P01_C01_bin.120]